MEKQLNVGDKVSFVAMQFNPEDPVNPIPVKVPGVIAHVEGDLANVYTEKKFNDADFIVKSIRDLTKE